MKSEILRTKLNRTIFPYLLRHSRLTKLYRDLPEQIVKKYAGHSPDSKMPAVYSHISSKDVKDVILEQIYNVKEITPTQKEDLQKQILENAELTKKILEILEGLKITKSITQNKKLHEDVLQAKMKMSLIKKQRQIT